MAEAASVGGAPSALEAKRTKNLLTKDAQAEAKRKGDYFLERVRGCEWLRSTGRAAHPLTPLPSARRALRCGKRRCTWPRMCTRTPSKCTAGRRSTFGWMTIVGPTRQTHNAAPRRPAPPDHSQRTTPLSAAGDQAAAAYVRMAEEEMHLQRSMEAALAYTDAGHMLVRVEPQEAIRVWLLAVKAYLAVGRHYHAAVLCNEMGLLKEQEGSAVEALEHFGEAAKHFAAEHETELASKCWLRVGRLYAAEDMLGKAARVFRDMAERALAKNMTQLNAPRHLLAAGLCQLARGDPDWTLGCIARYKRLDVFFSSSREHRFLLDIVEALRMGNMQRFIECVYAYDNVEPFDAWSIGILARCRDELAARAEYFAEHPHELPGADVDEAGEALEPGGDSSDEDSGASEVDSEGADLEEELEERAKADAAQRVQRQAEARAAKKRRW
jgi:alpha-soluble NSF attachment protein